MRNKLFYCVNRIKIVITNIFPCRLKAKKLFFTFFFICLKMSARCIVENKNFISKKPIVLAYLRLYNSLIL